MKYRIAMWASAGFLVAACWALYFAMRSKDNPVEPIVHTLFWLTQPVVLFLEQFGDLIVRAREAAKGANPRVSIFGEGVHLLWAKGEAEAAIQIEKLCNKLTQKHNMDILCGYFLGRVESAMGSNVYQRICAEHSAVYWR